MGYYAAMPNFIEALESSIYSPTKLLLPEDDERVRSAASSLKGSRLTPLRLDDFFLDDSAIVAHLNARDTKKRLSPGDADRLSRDPLYRAAFLLQRGEVDVVVCGATRTTAEVIRAGLAVLDRTPGNETISSAFLMCPPNREPVTFADCGVIPEPTLPQLVDITIAASEFHRLVTGATPRVALLSFSTHGSAKHPRSELMAGAAKLARARAPHLCVDGELQFDAAVDAEIRQRKAPKSVLQGEANVFVFPSLEAGNITYKALERFGGASAYGPILLGFVRPWLDLSRGCSAQDIVAVSLIGARLRQAQKL